MSQDTALVQIHVKDWIKITAATEQVSEEEVVKRLTYGYLLVGNSPWDLLEVLSSGFVPMTMDELVEWAAMGTEESGDLGTDVYGCLEWIWETNQVAYENRNSPCFG